MAAAPRRGGEILETVFVFYQPAFPRFRVDELPDSCLLTLPNIDEDDVGSYKAIFPGKLLDNLKIKVALKKAAPDKGDFAWVS